mgnify:FL=1
MVENRLHRAIKLKNLKKIIILIFVVFSVNTIMAQTLSSRNYSSSDLGYTYTVSVKHEGHIITITESNRVNQYKSNGGNTYYHIEQKYAHFYIKVAAGNKYYAGKQGSSEQVFTYSGGQTNQEEALPSGIDNCPLYDKYLKLSKTDHVNTQAWAFCGAAALAKCTYTDATPYLKPLIEALKSIMEEASKCPCTDAIKQSEWNAVPDN